MPKSDVRSMPLVGPVVQLASLDRDLDGHAWFAPCWTARTGPCGPEVMPSGTVSLS